MTVFEQRKAERDTMNLERIADSLEEIIESKRMREEAFMHELWDEAHFIASKNYEEDYGCSWEDADKYERQDYIQSVFENLCAREGLKL